MGRIRGSVGHSERAGCVATSAGAESCRRRGAYFLCAAAWIEKNRGSKFAHCLSGVEKGAARGSHSRNAAESGLDGRGICPVSEVFEGEHRAACRARWARKLSGRPAARERRAVSDGAHRRVGGVFLCPRALWISSALHGPANRQSEDWCARQWLPVFVRESSDFQK